MVETLISSLRPIGNIVLICCAFFIIFGILGVQVRAPLAPGVWLWSAAAGSLEGVMWGWSGGPGARDQAAG